MANSLYDWGRDAFANKLIDWVNDDIRIALLTSAYAPNLATHKFVSDLTNIVARSASLSGKSTSAGIENATNYVFSALSGSAVAYIAIYQYNASDAAARLIALIDTATGLPVTPNGADLTIQWDSGTNKIFKL